MLAINESEPQVEHLHDEYPTIHQGYTDWRQVAGYFDGDGSVGYVPGRFTVGLRAIWTDTYKPQLEHIQDFLASEGLSPSKMTSKEKKRSSTITLAWNLLLSERGGVLYAFRKMLPYVDKKRDQVRNAIAYLENTVTGEELIENFNQAVKLGTRSGKIRQAKMAWTKQQGVRLSHSRAGGRAWVVKKTVSPQLLQKMRVEREDLGMTFRKIAEVNSISYSTVFRLIRPDSPRAH